MDEVDLLIDGPPPPATSSSDKSKKSEAVFSNGTHRLTLGAAPSSLYQSFLLCLLSVGTEELLSASALDIYSLSSLAGFNWLVAWLGTTVRLGWSDRSGAALAAHNSYLTILEEQVGHSPSQTTPPLRPLPLSDHSPSQTTPPLRPLPLSDHSPSQATPPLRPLPLSDHSLSQATPSLRPLPLSGHSPSQATSPLRPLPLSDHSPSQATSPLRPLPSQATTSTD